MNLPDTLRFATRAATGYPLRRPGLELQAHQRLFGIRKVTDNFADGLGEFAHQGRDGNDLVALGQLGLFQQVDHFDMKFGFPMLVADAMQIGNRRQRFWRLACNIKAQDPIAAILFSSNGGISDSFMVGATRVMWCRRKGYRLHYRAV
jgi:hypothetical protein